MKTYKVILLSRNGSKMVLFEGNYYKARKHAESAKRDGLHCYITSKQKQKHKREV